DEADGDGGDEQDERGRDLRTHDAPETRPLSGPGALCRNSRSEVWSATGLAVALEGVDAALQVGCVDHAVTQGGRGREAPLRFLLHRFLARRVEIHPPNRTAGAIDRNDRARART